MTYRELIEKRMYLNILLKVDDVDYQGDSFVIVQRRMGNITERGYLKIGWGSCSGCDALQAAEDTYCGDPEVERQKLADDLTSRIQWFADADFLREWVAAHDWEGDYCSFSAACAVFRAIVSVQRGIYGGYGVSFEIDNGGGR